ncbi:MAG: hypothetical protein IKG85_10680 [Clostridia bacterium]|nr:hypothetical protein [Clostridia bacterium]
MDKALNVLSLIFNALIFLFMVKCVVGFFRFGGRGNMQVSAAKIFRYFTVQSNIIMALAAALMLVYNVMILAGAAAEAPCWVMTVKLVCTVAVMLTFSVVFFIFVPGTGVKPMIEGDNVFMHLVSPLMAAVTFVLFDRGPKLSYWGILWGMLPTLLYAALYYHMVMRRGENNGGWEDFYRFNANGRWYLAAAAIFIMTALIGFLLTLGHDLLGAGVLA